MTAFAEELLAKVGGRATIAARVKPRTALPVLPPPPPVVETPVEVIAKPVERHSITKAARETGISRDTIYRLYRSRFIKGWQVSPKKILIDAADLRDFLVVSAQAGFWTPERKARYNGKAVTS